MAFPLFPAKAGGPLKALGNTGSRLMTAGMRTQNTRNICKEAFAALHYNISFNPYLCFPHRDFVP